VLPSLKLANLWRVIRDVDLDGIRAAAVTPFELAIVSEEPGLAQDLRAALSPIEDEALHPWIVTIDPEDFRTRPVTPILALLVSRDPDLSPAMKGADEHAIRAGVPRATVIVGVASQLAAARRLAETARVAVSDLSPSSLQRLATAVVPLIQGNRRLALGAALPVFRPAVAESIVEETARANGSFAFTTGLAQVVPVLTAPLNLGDMVVLTKNQLIMGYRIMLASGRDGDPRSMMSEVLAVLGGGLLFRQMARQLVGLIPVAGIVPKVVIAYGGTWAMGRALTAWSMGGAEVTADSVKRYSGEGLERGRQMAGQLMSGVRDAAPASRRSWQRLRGWLPLRRGGPPVPSSE
jgi:uncharacterized protein (DUF697 family)